MTALADLIQRSWPLFREAALQGRTLSYSELAGRVGPPLSRRQVHRQLLIPLSVMCRAAGLPQLPALVVRKDTGKPGLGYHGTKPHADPERGWADDLAACFAYPWPMRVDKRLLALAKSDTLTHK